jgi:alpha-D-ribose 1-methylphosphonate 5-triphosphate synthase subunit PhnH
MNALLCRGLADPVHDAGRVFRRLLDALAQPGRPANLLDAFAGLEDAPSGAARPLAAALLALADFETPVWLDHDAEGLVRSLVNFHCGAALVDDPRLARFAVVTEPGRMPPLATFDWGSAEYPDRGATLLISVACLDGGAPVTLTGPGIATATSFAPQGLPDHFWSQRTSMGKDFPRGVDCFLFDDHRVAGLPRTTQAREDQ